MQLRAVQVAALATALACASCGGDCAETEGRLEIQVVDEVGDPVMADRVEYVDADGTKHTANCLLDAPSNMCSYLVLLDGDFGGEVTVEHCGATYGAAVDAVKEDACTWVDEVVVSVVTEPCP